MKEYKEEKQALIEVIEENPYRIWVISDLMKAVNEKIISLNKRFTKERSFSNLILRRNIKSPYYLFRNNSGNLRRIIFAKK